MSERLKTYDRKPIITPERAYDLTREIRGRGENVLIVNDFDETISQGEPPQDGYNQGDDPRRVIIHPKAGKALIEIAKSGGYNGIITNRGGADVAGKLAAIGLHQTKIVGTFGWELYKQDDANGRRVEIDKKFLPYANVITQTLQVIREGFLEELGNPRVAGDEAYIVVPTNPLGKTTKEQGPMIIQQKGVSHEFPLGLANGYNFNLISRDTGIRKLLTKRIEETFQKVSLPDELLSIWAMRGDGIRNSRSADPDADLRFSRGFEPIIERGKGNAMVKLIRAVMKEQEKKGEQVEKIGLIYYAGDSDPDAYAMRAARLIESLTRGEVRSIGVWTKGGSKAQEVEKKSDLQVVDVDAHAEILQGIAAALG